MNLITLLFDSVGKAKVRFGDLPDDLQQLIVDFAYLDEDSTIPEENSTLPLYEVPTRLFPVRKVAATYSTSDLRDEGYAMGIPLSIPVVMVGNDWVDGRHRVWKARAISQETVPAINLNDLGVFRAVNSMGKLRKPFF